MSKDKGRSKKTKYRRTWTRNPGTKVCDSGKLYSRPEEKRRANKELKDAQSD